MIYDEKFIIKEYIKGKTAKEIAYYLKTYNTTIRRILIRNNIILRSGYDVNVRSNNNLITEDTPEKHYWLGYLAADGCVHKDLSRIELNVAEKDRNHLLKFAEFTGTSIKKYLNSRYNTYTYKVIFRNKYICAYLNSIGITPNKSKTIFYKNTLNFDFLRGVFDGDGYIRKDGREFQIASASEKFIIQLYNFLKQNNIKNPIIRKVKDLYLLGIYNTNDYNKLFKLLYYDTSVKLERKFEIYKQNTATST